MERMPNHFESGAGNVCAGHWHAGKNGFEFSVCHYFSHGLFSGPVMRFFGGCGTGFSCRWKRGYFQFEWNRGVAE